jgi:hypothetical protein
VIVAEGGTTYTEFQLPADRFVHGEGRYRIRFDVQLNGQNFADLATTETPAKIWPVLEHVLTLSPCQTTSLYIPIVHNHPVAAAGQP